MKRLKKPKKEQDIEEWEITTLDHLDKLIRIRVDILVEDALERERMRDISAQQNLSK